MGFPEYATIGIPIFLGLVWLIRLEGRLNTAVALQDRLSADVQYIRRRIDQALNGRHEE